MAKSIQDPLTRTLFPEGYRKAQRRQLQILQAAIENYASRGVDNTTFETIAEACGVSRPLVQHYFSSKRAIFSKAVEYVRFHFQDLAVKAIAEETTAVAQLRAYVKCTFDWLKNFRSHASLWSLFYYYAGSHRTYRKLNEQFAKMGQERIEALIRKGISEGAFKCARPALNAKMIQAVIAGALITVGTEDISENQKDFESHITELCLSLAGAKSSVLH